MSNNTPITILNNGYGTRYCNGHYVRVLGLLLGLTKIFHCHCGDFLAAAYSKDHRQIARGEEGHNVQRCQRPVVVRVAFGNLTVSHLVEQREKSGFWGMVTWLATCMDQ